MEPSEIGESRVACNFDAVPDELRLAARWINWKPERRGAKFIKRPVNARVNDASTWLKFSEARTRAIAQGLGLGFVLGDGFIGIDFDHVIDDLGTVHPIVASTISRLRSYSEISPSGRGVHILLRASVDKSYALGATDALPQRELYADGRFFTFTGNVVGNVKTLAHGPEAQRALDRLVVEIFAPRQSAEGPHSLDDDALLEIAARAKNGPKFRRLFAGDTTGYKSHSEADIALCYMLCFWTDRDAARMDRLFRRSGLMRAKWDERRGDSTYGAGTIAKARSRGGHVYKGPQPTAQLDALVSEQRWGPFRLWWLLALRGSPHCALEVLCALCTFADKNCKAHPGRPLLVHLTGGSRDTVRRGVRILEQVGILSIRQRYKDTLEYTLRPSREGRSASPLLAPKARVPRHAMKIKRGPLEGRILGQEGAPLGAQIRLETYHEQSLCSQGEPHGELIVKEIAYKKEKTARKIQKIGKR